MKQLTKEQAIKFYENKCYENMSYRQIAEFQIEQDRLCVPFDIFHEAIEKTLGRPVFIHEFGLNREGLKKELFGEQQPPTFLKVMPFWYDIHPVKNGVAIKCDYGKEEIVISDNPVDACVAMIEKLHELRML